MRTLAIFALTSAVYAQVRPLSQGIVLRTDPNRINILPFVRAEPPNSPLIGKFSTSLRSQAPPNGPAFYTRMFVDEARHVYLGYELLLERKENGTYLATIGKLGVTPIDLAVSLSPRLPIDLQWTLLPLPAIPEPRLYHDGETIRIDLLIDPSGDKLIDDVRINPPSLLPRFMPVPAAALPVPTVSGDPRDFSAADAEMQIVRPRGVTLNGDLRLESLLRSVRGRLVWIYLPGHGRYILSLIPRPGLDFTIAGEVRGGVISFTVGKDSINLESTTPIATGDAPYHLWVLHDKDWEPVSESQKDHANVGSVGPAELAALKQK